MAFKCCAARRSCLDAQMPKPAFALWRANWSSRIPASSTRKFRHARRFAIPPRDWWHEFLFKEFEPDEIEWLISDDEKDESEKDEIDRMLDDDEAYAAWKQKTDAIRELRYYRKIGRVPESEDWEDWLDETWGRNSWYPPETGPDLEAKEEDLLRQREEVEMRFIRKKLRDPAKRNTGPFSKLFQDPLEFDEEENEFLKGFAEFAAWSTVRFVACLIVIPWVVDFAVHDYVLLPFLKRYVDLVPLAERTFDVRDSQKIKRVIPELHDYDRLIRYQAGIGVAPLLSDKERKEVLHEKALELLEEVRAENRSNFANIWSDMVAGITFFLLLVLNPIQVELMSFSGNRILNNLSVIGKAFFMILLSDMFLGYHSESGWEAILELLLEHYGWELPMGVIYGFVAFVPVTIDAAFKLWVFSSLPRINPAIAATFREMQRH